MCCQAAKGKLPKEERCKQNDTRNVHLSFADFRPGLGVIFLFYSLKSDFGSQVYLYYLFDAYSFR